MEQIEEGLDLIWLLFVITHVGQKCLLWVIAGGRMTRRIRVQGCFLFACGFVCLLAFRIGVNCRWGRSASQRKDQSHERFCGEFKDNGNNGFELVWFPSSGAEVECATPEGKGLTEFQEVCGSG